MLKLAVVLLAVCCQALQQCSEINAKGGDQNDLPNWDFQKENPQSNTPFPGLKPYNPVCEFEAEGLFVREAFQGDWSCIIDNKSNDPYVVRVQTTANDDDPRKDNSWAFYYFVPPKQSTLANPGKAGAREVCRLCGARKVVDNGQDWNGIKALEQASYDFQCRRRCQAVLYEHRNFNGNSMTIASNIASLRAFNLAPPPDAPANEKPKVSSLKIFGKGCELRLYEKADYDGNGGSSPICTFTAQNDISSWDMDALRAKCCDSQKCKTGQDCFESVAIRDRQICGTQAFSNDKKPAGCPGGTKAGCHESTRNDLVDAKVTADRVVALERLFKAMAAVLEE